MIDLLATTLLFPADTTQPGELSRVLVALEEEPQAAPTHASYDERKRLPYDREAALQSFGLKRSRGINLWRGQVPKYTNGYLSTHQTVYNHVSADYSSSLRKFQLLELFATWTRLAAKLEPEFGLVHMRWSLGAESEEYNYGFRLNPKELRQFGFCSLHSRTWFGPDLTSVIGEQRLLALPNTEKTPWGGLQLDLVENPWLADFSTMARRQREVESVFASWGLMGNYSNSSNVIPGPNWTPRLWSL
jgi:hypothetical protein